MTKYYIKKCVNPECKLYDKDVCLNEEQMSESIEYFGFSYNLCVICEECKQTPEKVASSTDDEFKEIAEYVKTIDKRDIPTSFKSPTDIGKNYYGKKNSLTGRWD